ncbi:Asp-tRNA(Asn)/Glu-tRNA(Gln) amidotransferase subunit GatA [Amphibiibacter pelophylacis]|uniref:Asp-tRNA(Asn)/Glu-tRNA(Gln) amidotransferase subunit GatA n=1 Tax=Amphibiibacter pelophylacis TaxID=1799477 RepID=A0ACC6P5D0_9BURK
MTSFSSDSSAGLLTSVQDQHQALASGQTSAVELCQAALARIAAHDDLGAFLHVDAEAALTAARASDARRASGAARGVLDGIPLAHKDIFVTRGMPSTAGSKMLDGYLSPFDASVVERLAQAGAVSVGKLNCDEFAMGGSNEHSAFRPAINPWSAPGQPLIPGGSSGGSAVAVAARLLAATTGTDTGGSIRQPAALCGITGIKPTYGRCPRWGMVAFASSLDQAGPMAQTAWDCAALLQAMSGFDERDATSAPLPVPDWLAELAQPVHALAPRGTAQQPLGGLRIGLPKEFFGDGVQPEVLAATQAALAELQRLGAELVDIALPRTPLAIPVYYIIAPAEASSNLSRFDGVRYGHRADSPRDLAELYTRSRTEGFGEEVKRRIMMGTYVLSHGYYDAYYLQAQKLRRMIVDDFQAAFAQCDLIAGPVSPTVARALHTGEAVDSDPLQDYLADIFTLPASLAGLPGLSLPAGLGAQSGLPVGLQLMANYWQEGALLHAAHLLQQHTGWHRLAPAGFEGSAA